MLHCRNVRPDILGWRTGRPPLWRHVSEGGATITPLVTFAFIPFHHTINRFVFCETGEIDNLSAVGGKVFG